MMAKLMPEKVLLDNLKTAIAKYEATPNDDTKGTLSMFSMLLTTRMSNDCTPEQLIDELNKAQKAKDFFTTNPH